MGIEQAIRDVVHICRKLPILGLATGSTGNVSIRDPQSGRIAIKCSGVNYSEMSNEDVAVLNADGSVAYMPDGKKSSFETPTHLFAYQRCTEANCVIHTHTKFAIVLSADMNELPCNTTPTGRRLLKRPVPVVDFVENGTLEMAEVIVPVLMDNPAVCIRNHGTFVIGDTAKEAFDRVVALNDATEVYYYMRLLGTARVLADR